MSTTDHLDGGATLEILTPLEVKERFDRNAIALIDVRTPNEYIFEHIAGSLLFPLAFFQAEKLPSQDGKPIVFFCGAGPRSRRVAERSATAGLTTLALMEGGFAAWKAAGLPYVTVDPATGNLVTRP